MTSRFWRGCYPRFARGIATLAGGCPRFAPDIAVLAWRFTLGTRPVMRFCCRVLPSFTPVFFPLSGKKRRLAMCCVPIPPGRDRHSCVLAALARLSRMAGSLWDCAFLYGDPDGITGDAGLRSWRRGLCTLLRNRIGLESLSAGNTLGLRAPDCAKESSTLWTLLTLRRDCVGAYSRPLCAFARVHWPCNAFRREYAGAARPRLRQRVVDSLDSPHTAAGLGWCVVAAPSPGYTERPARL